MSLTHRKPRPTPPPDPEKAFHEFYGIFPGEALELLRPGGICDRLVRHLQNEQIEAVCASPDLTLTVPRAQGAIQILADILDLPRVVGELTQESRDTSRSVPTGRIE